MRKNAPLAAGKEMRGLALIRTTGIDVVVGADGNIERLFLIPVEVTEQNAEGSIGVREPAFECGGDALPGVMRGLDIDCCGRTRTPIALSAQDAKTERCISLVAGALRDPLLDNRLREM